MKLKELLEAREVKDLFLLTNRIHIPHPMNLSKEDIDLLRKAYLEEPEDRQLYIDEFEDPPVMIEPDSDEELTEEDLEIIERLRQYHEQRRRTGELLMDAETHKQEYAKLLVPHLLKTETVRSFLEAVPDEAGEFIHSILSGILKQDEEGYYSLKTDPNQNCQFEYIERHGYGFLRRIPWYKTEEERERITGVLIPEDVLEVFRQTETPELLSARRIWNALSMCMDIISGYYEIAPVSVLHRLYNILQQAEPDRYPVLSGEKINHWIDETAETDRFFSLCVHYQGEDYLTCTYETEITDDTSPEDCSLVMFIQHQKACGYDFYLPAAEEIRNYRKYGYDLSRKSFGRLKQFVKEAYLDEKAMEDISARMFSMVIDDEESLLKRRYSMDWVEEQTLDKFLELQMDLAGGNDAESLMEYHEDFVAGFTDEAKQEWKEILEECVETGPQRWYLGHSLQEVREKQLEDL